MRARTDRGEWRPGPEYGAWFRSALETATGGGPVDSQTSAVPEFVMPERPPLVFMDAGGGLWMRTMEGGTPAFFSLGIYGKGMSHAEVTAAHGDLLRMEAMPAVQPAPAPALLSAVGFDGKFAECGRRRPDGQWCEQRWQLRHLSLPVLVSECERHMREVHGG